MKEWTSEHQVHVWKNICDIIIVNFDQILSLLFSSYFFFNFIQGYFLCTRLDNNIWIQVQNYYLVYLFYKLEVELSEV